MWRVALLFTCWYAVTAIAVISWPGHTPVKHAPLLCALFLALVSLYWYLRKLGISESHARLKARPTVLGLLLLGVLGAATMTTSFIDYKYRSLRFSGTVLVAGHAFLIIVGRILLTQRAIGPHCHRRSDY